MPVDIKALFEEELELIQEEEPLMPHANQCEVAKERLIERLTGYVVRVASQRKWAHIDGVNMTHFRFSFG